jgi:hypothetical protein
MDDIFYVTTKDGKLVSAKFSSYGGSLISDPITSNAVDTKIYDASGYLISNANAAECRYRFGVESMLD